MTASDAISNMVNLNLNPDNEYGRCSVPVYAEFQACIVNGTKPFTRLISKQSNTKLVDVHSYLPDDRTWTLLRSHEFGTKGLNEIRLFTDDNDRVMALVTRSTKTSISITLCGPNEAEVHEMVRKIAKKIPNKVVADHVVDTWVWAAGPQGPESNLKKIEAQSWDEISDNYTQGIREALTTMMSYERPSGQGKIVLWHGPPGTGKTTALRSLAREWKDWCSFHYISDPEKFFSLPKYLMDVGSSSGTVEIEDDELSEGEEEPDDGSPEDEDYAEIMDERRLSRRTPWRLVVAEDAGEFLRARQRGDASAAMSRLLNFSDGILGAGSNTIFLITTNEEIDRLDKAVTRPGRCLAQVEFKEFDSNLARQWMLKRGISKNYHGPVSLAQLMEDLKANESDRVTTGIAEPEAVGQYL